MGLSIGPIVTTGQCQLPGLADAFQQLGQPLLHIVWRVGIQLTAGQVDKSLKLFQDSGARRVNRQGINRHAAVLEQQLQFPLGYARIGVVQAVGNDHGDTPHLVHGSGRIHQNTDGIIKHGAVISGGQ